MYPNCNTCIRSISTILLLLWLSKGFSQENSVEILSSYDKVYSYTEQQYGLDQFLTNGIYFEDIYRSADGYPYKNSNDFQKGTLIYRDRFYRGIELKYDLFHQRLLLKSEHPNFAITTVLTNDFISAFSFPGMEFKRVSFADAEPAFFQVIVDKGDVQCYYSWFKQRKETIKGNNKMIYSFSREKRRTYVLVFDALEKYHTNSSFIRIFPANLKEELKDYLKSKRIKVKKANDQEMKDLILYCQFLMHNSTTEGS